MHATTGLFRNPKSSASVLTSRIICFVVLKRGVSIDVDLWIVNTHCTCGKEMISKDCLMTQHEHLLGSVWGTWSVYCASTPRTEMNSKLTGTVKMSYYGLGLGLGPTPTLGAYSIGKVCTCYLLQAGSSVAMHEQARSYSGSGREPLLAKRWR